MELLSTVLRVYESGDPQAAFQAMADALSDLLPLHCALWVGPQERTLHCVHPSGTEVPPELLDMAAYTLHAEVFPLNSLVPHAEERFSSAEVLLLPLPHASPPSGSVALIAPRGTFGEDLDPWERLGTALGRVAQQQERLRRLEAERDALRRRAEEIEALDVLGLAANRTLDLDEVLALVARFTRTLLGANYVTVSTTAGGEIRTHSTVGLHSSPSPDETDPFASPVIAAGKPLTIDEVGGSFQVHDFPLHVREGMQAGFGVPLSLYGKTFGALVVGYRRPYQLNSGDTRLALTLAGHAAVAISNAQLHQAVETHSRELEEAYDQLRRISQAKERFFNAISHDLRTPVSAIKGYHELLLEGTGGELPPQAHRFLENSRRAAESLLTLVNDLLDLAKIEAGKMELELEIRSCPLPGIIEDAILTVRPQAEAKGILLAVEPLEEMPPVRSDAKRVRQILVNLLSNAVKFTERGEVRLAAVQRAETPLASTEAAYAVEIHVSDTGPGIAAEDLARIFEEFEQVKGAVGTGLGLPISQRLARLLGGDLRAESQVGIGSTFILRLPGGPDAAGEDTAAVKVSGAI